MADDSLLPGEVIGIIIGAVALFSIISVVPMLIMWIHRRHAPTRRAPARRTSETLNLTSSMQQVSVDRWLAEQNTPSDASHYAQDTCAICLSPLSSSPYLSTLELAHLPDTPPSKPNDEKHRHDPLGENCIIVLNRCHHAFHLSCLTSWFEYRRYKCPICQASYSPDETMC
ncbi:uncharacterized protein N7483_002213 [Penicillium malachiteum]|uniref:uncharacterized protein n=1 Tax=Penicillium malachiteum TaxID=1324776 RepID=UPI0025477496|nr:uncharacterized protein N7483_002213 [Penicillium malachiteum]KAJ5737088.1 hypothetical protein N7483_002213 [Penicillium malachiteum]